MQSLGYCCGKKHTYSPQTLCCYGQQNTICTIPRDAKYFVYENKYVSKSCELFFSRLNFHFFSNFFHRNPTPALVSDKYTFCAKCFNDVPGDSVSLGDDPSQPQV